MRTLQEQIEHYLSYFEWKQREDGSDYVVAHDKPEELQDAIHEAHGNKMPEDWTYSTFYHILETMGEYDADNLQDYETLDYRTEIVDGLVDIYTSELTAWLHSHNSNAYYLTEALEQFPGIKDRFKLLGLAQYLAIDEVYQRVYELLDMTEGEDWE